VPDNLSAELKEEIGSIARENSRVQAMLDLNNKTHIGLKEAKGIVIHLTDKNSLCHRCKTQLGEEEYCPKCRSLNLNW
jgi:Zn finger protein HypA/HybF involved in hydrogenase expression